MFYYFVTHFIEGYQGTPFRLFEYITFRAAGAFATAALIVLFFGLWTIRRLKKFAVSKSNRMEGLVAEKYIDHSKDKVPSMGGLLIVSGIAVATILWGDLSNQMVLVFLLVLIPLTLLGFYDDYIKIRYDRKVKDGVSGKFKLAIQALVSIVVLYIIYSMKDTKSTKFYIPFLKDPICIQPYYDTASQLGAALVETPSEAVTTTPVAAYDTIAFWLPTQLLDTPLFTCAASWAPYLYGAIFVVNILFIMFFSNATNLTDGKDGLMAGSTIFCVLALGLIAYFHGHFIFAKHLMIPYIDGIGEITIFTSAMAGACIGFLWYNCKPASVFMGDTGSLPIGGCLALLAILMGQHVLLCIIGFVFVMEAVSVMLQVASFKLTGKRIFLCTPIHHHFEQKGWTETQIVTRFWIIAGICAMIGLISLKLR